MRYLILPLLVLGLFGCQRTEEFSWKKGNFYYEEEPFGVFRIERNDSMQVEYLDTLGLVTQFRINWMNDTTYTLQFDRILKNESGISLPPDLGDLVKTCAMVGITDSSYMEMATSNLNDAIHMTEVHVYPTRR